MAQPSVHGRFIWQELLTEDTGAAAVFYSKVIGWRVQPSQDPAAHNYSMFATDQGAVGGLTSLPDHAREAGARPHWLPYVGAENVDATAAKAERLGGRVLRAATDVGHLGRYAVLADPQGATFGIYRPKSPSGSMAKSQPQRGEFGWQELASSDFEAAFRFYADLFGWQPLRRMDMGPAGSYLIFGRDGVEQGGMYKLSSQMPAPYWLSYIEVPRTESAVDTVRGMGGRVTIEPMDVPGGGRIAQMLDPAGVLFAVHTTGRDTAGAGAGTTAAAGDSGKPESVKPAAAKPARVAKAAEKPASPGRGAKKVAKKAGKRATARPGSGSKSKSKNKSKSKSARRGAGRGAGRGAARGVRAKTGAKPARRAKAGRAGARRAAAKRPARSARGAGGARRRGRAARRR